jgi:transcriptional regulator with XRE-family HTH domain
MIMKQLAKAIKESGQSRYQISKATGIDQAVLCRIATGSGTGSSSLKTLDVLCEYLGLELVKKKGKTKEQKSAPAHRSGKEEVKQGQ